MRTELINILLKAGVITEEQLERAAQYESGSSLVERFLSLGYGSQEDVYKVLQNKMNFAVVAGNALMDADAAAITVIPKDLVEKHHALPFHADGSSVHVAMFDPTQTDCIEEIRFFTSQEVVPYGAMASDLTKALNKHYGLGLPENFKYGTENIASNYTGKTPPPIKTSTPTVPRTVPGAVNLPPIPTSAGSRPAAAAKLTPVAGGVDLPPLPGQGPKPEPKLEPKPETKPEVKAEPKPETKPETKPEPKPVVKTEPEPQPQAKPEPKPVVQEKPEPKVAEQHKPAVSAEEEMPVAVDYDEEEPEFRDICEVFPQATKAVSSDDVEVCSIERAKDKDSVLSACLGEMKKISSRCLILFVKYDDLVAVAGSGNRIEENMQGFSLSLKEPSVFKTVLDSKKEYYGPFTMTAVEQAFIARFGNERPQSVTIVPSILDEEVFAMLYTEETPIVEEVKRVAAAMSSVFDRLLNG